jgi:hypothetical protein
MSLESTQQADPALTSSQASAPTSTNKEPTDDAAHHAATIVVRGEAVSDTAPRSPPKDHEVTPAKEVAAGKVALQSRLPLLEDDGDVGVQTEHIVIRDGKADLAFTGTLLASAAPSAAPKGQWHEYRIYETNGGKHVFSKVTRTVYAADQDVYEADVFDPSPQSVPSQLLRSARDLTRSKPLTWMDAAVAFFGYDPLAKALYRKLGGQFEERIN